MPNLKKRRSSASRHDDHSAKKTGAPKTGSGPSAKSRAPAGKTPLEKQVGAAMKATPETIRGGRLVSAFVDDKGFISVIASQNILACLRFSSRKRSASHRKRC